MNRQIVCINVNLDVVWKFAILVNNTGICDALHLSNIVPFELLIELSVKVK